MIQSDTFDHSPLPVGFRPRGGKARKSEWECETKKIRLDTSAERLKFIWYVQFLKKIKFNKWDEKS